MVKGTDWLISLAIHGTAVGAVAAACLMSPPAAKEEVIPICFELVEAAMPAALATGPVPSEPGPVPTCEPTCLGTDPTECAVEVGTDPRENMGTDPEDVGTDPRENMGTDPKDVGTGPAVDAENAEESEENSDETANTADTEEKARVVSDPIALNQIVPKYPRSARRKGHEGAVTVAVAVAENGEVAQANVVSSSGHQELDAAALGAVRTAKFAPATENGTAVSGQLRLTIEFRLE